MELQVDVAVVGSGAAGLVAACRAADGNRSVVVLEKADLLGGTSAVSGGVMWMPNHHLMGKDHPDSAEDALAYLTAATGGKVSGRPCAGTSRRRARRCVGWIGTPGCGWPRFPGPTITPNGRAPPAAAGWTTCPSTAQEFPALASRIRPPTYFPSITMTERDAMAASGIDTDLIARGTRRVPGRWAGR